MGENHWQDRFQRKWTFGERAADTMASFGGSWVFLGSLGGFIILWCIWNLVWGYVLPRFAFDPYPFILLNLFLSMLASIQAPVIMMSQNRQSAIDRNQSGFINSAILGNENQTKHVDAKLDHLISYQWKRLLEIQEIQIQLLQEAVLEVDSQSGTKHLNPQFWSGVSEPDEFAKFLLRKSDGSSLREEDQLIFTHWHREGFILECLY